MPGKKTEHLLKTTNVLTQLYIVTTLPVYHYILVYLTETLTNIGYYEEA